MKGLLIDTSAKPGIISLSENQSVIKTKLLLGSTSKYFFPALSELVPLEELSYIAVGIGPGSYIGVRSCATVAQTLKFALKIPLVPFPSALAFIPRDVKGSFAFVGKARGEKKYLVTGTLGETIEVSHPTLIPQEELPPYLEGKDHILSDDHLRFEPDPTWATQYGYKQFIEGETTSEPTLELCYLG